jgi:ribA/ribD-fused uncharacterized protein
MLDEMSRSNTISFYRTGDPYGEFSNFAAFPIVLKGVVWPTSEHFFQAQKFAGTVHEEQVRRAASPMLATKMGRDRSRPLRADWEAVKDQIMRQAVAAKFQQHPALRDLLLSTGDARLVEHTQRFVLGRRRRRLGSQHARTDPRRDASAAPGRISWRGG